MSYKIEKQADTDQISRNIQKYNKEKAFRTESSMLLFSWGWTPSEHLVFDNVACNSGLPDLYKQQSNDSKLCARGSKDWIILF